MTISGHGNSIHNIIPLLKKENVDLSPCPSGHNNNADVYFLSSLEDMALEVTASSIKEYGCNLQDTFRSIGCAITIAS